METPASEKKAFYDGKLLKSYKETIRILFVRVTILAALDWENNPPPAQPDAHDLAIRLLCFTNIRCTLYDFFILGAV